MTAQLEALKTITQSSFSQEIFQNTSLIEKMQSLIVQFQSNKGQWITSNCQLIKEGNVHYYGIHKNQQFQTARLKQDRYIRS